MKSLSILAFFLLVLFADCGSSTSVENEPKADAVAAWPHYPPCVSASCTNQLCCAQGHKFRWPELVGKNEQQAKAVIQTDNPLVTVVSLPPGRVGFADFCCNRVYLVLDKNGNVFSVPIVG